MEKINKPMSGYLAFVLCILIGLFGILAFYNAVQLSGGWSIITGLLFIAFVFTAKGIKIVNPNHSLVLTFFGKYVGSIKQNGLLWVNPLFGSQKISLRANNLNGQTLKVNDKMGNPIEIAAVIVWQVSDTYRAAFEVEGYQQYVQVQSEAAVRHLATSCPYERLEDETAEITLRDGGEKVNELLEQELNERLAAAGITVREARISHLAYAPEIAGAMLQRQQATAIVAARSKIVEGAVGMVEMALEHLSRKQIVTLDEERKAAMVSNLMVVLCGEKAATPVLNTGSLYQ
ncbi:SPFH domain-containing protein [Chitinophaga sp.]|uniref:SPFH domain-containing protein n=1 Tax=Chitinophaga sp. TaxID=1869181 RepID=UPI0031E2D040